jgi:hypothetical protein
MKIRNDIQIRGIAFAGCSFTWGQGLYYYSNLPTLSEPGKFKFQPELLTAPQIKYMESVRWPRLVATHFNSFELTQPFNGGAVYTILGWWNTCFKNFLDGGSPKNPEVRCDYSEISHLVFQMTQWHRSQKVVQFNSGELQCSHFELWTTYKDEFFVWLDKNGITLDEYVDQAKKRDVREVSTWLQSLEQRGIKISILTWPADLVQYILDDPWLADRFISFDYNGSSFDSIEGMIEQNKHLEIINDYEFFEVPPIDHHPSLACQPVIAAAVIKHIEKNEIKK